TSVGSLFNLHATDAPVTDYRSSARSNKEMMKWLRLALLNEGVMLSPRGMGCLSLPLNDDERRLQAELDEIQLVALLTELVRRPSVSGEEKPTVEHLAGFLGDHGLAVELTEAAPGRPNLVCRWGAD